MNAPPAAPLGRFLTLADAAEVLNITIREVRDLIVAGDLPAIRVGTSGPWRIERFELENYIEAMYEEARRHSLWNQSEQASIAELSFGDTRGPGRATMDGTAR